MLVVKSLKECTFREVKEYNEAHYDITTRAVLAVFRSLFQQNEISWRMRIAGEFPTLFSQKVLDYKIQVRISRNCEAQYENKEK